jgi:hypothetical protein
MQPIKKIIAIGDSFLAGSELKNPNLVWPGLFAEQYGFEYHCLAQGGHTSQYVLRTLLDTLHRETEPCFFVIHWPSAIRFEYVDRDSDNWIQINPNAVLNGNKYSQEIQTMYYKHMNSLLGDKWHNLLMIYTAIQALELTQHCYALTTVDDFLFSTDFHNPDYIKFLQKNCKDRVHWFEGMTFLQWSDRNNHKRGPLGHPLEEAHRHAFEYFEPTYKKLIATTASNK